MFMLNWPNTWFNTICAYPGANVVYWWYTVHVVIPYEATDAYNNRMDKNLPIFLSSIWGSKNYTETAHGDTDHIVLKCTYRGMDTTSRIMTWNT